MGFTKFLLSLNPFSTTRTKKRRIRKNKKNKKNTRRRIMHGG